MLTLQNITIAIQDEETVVVDDVSLQIEKGKNYCLLGTNGSGKSSLALTIMGHPNYEMTGGDILVDGESIRDMDPHERAQRGIFLAFQTIPQVPGVKLFEFLRTIYNAKYGTQETFVSFKKIIMPHLETLGIDKEFLRRDVNVGFSGGERRKVEILQLQLLQPTYIFLDEVDSGLDVDAFKAVASLLQSVNTSDNSFILITHYFSILDYIDIDTVYVMKNGRVEREGSIALARHIQDNGFAQDA